MHALYFKLELVTFQLIKYSNMYSVYVNLWYFMSNLEDLGDVVYRNTVLFCFVVDVLECS